MISILSVNAQTPNWQWAKSAGGTGSAFGLIVSTDAIGNVFMTGYFKSPTITFGTTTLTNAGSNDVFIVKYDATGNVLWAKSVGGAYDERGQSVSTDASGNVFMTGYFISPTISFGTTTLTNTYASNLYSDFFIVKYDTSGNVLWAKSAEGAYDDSGQSVSTDASGNVFITGIYYSPTITFGTTTLTKTNPTNNYSDIFIVKYDASGNMLWATSAEDGAFNDDGRSVSTDASGNVLIAGYFASPTITFGTTTLTNTNSSWDIFIVKYDSSGNVLWAKSAGGTAYDIGNSVSTDAIGNVFMTGIYYSPTITFGITTLTNANNVADIFIVKYDASGNVLWAKSAEGTWYDLSYGVCTDVIGNVFITGAFYSPTITFGTTTLTNVNAANDIFIVKYDASGNVLWAKSAGGTGYDEGYAVSTDASGNVFLTGNFGSPNINFGTTTLTNTDTTGSFRDIFIAKLDGTTGTNDIKNANIKIYPNPTNNIINIEGLTKNENNTIQIFDVQGKLVITKNISEKGTIDLSELNKGVYVIKIGEVAQRIVKM